MFPYQRNLAIPEIETWIIAVGTTQYYWYIEGIIIIHDHMHQKNQLFFSCSITDNNNNRILSNNGECLTKTHVA